MSEQKHLETLIELEEQLRMSGGSVELEISSVRSKGAENRFPKDLRGHDRLFLQYDWISDVEWRIVVKDSNAIDEPLQILYGNRDGIDNGEFYWPHRIGLQDGDSEAEFERDVPIGVVAWVQSHLWPIASHFDGVLSYEHIKENCIKTVSMADPKEVTYAFSMGGFPYFRVYPSLSDKDELISPKLCARLTIRFEEHAPVLSGLTFESEGREDRLSWSGELFPLGKSSVYKRLVCCEIVAGKEQPIWSSLLTNFSSCVDEDTCHEIRSREKARHAFRSM